MLNKLLSLLLPAKPSTNTPKEQNEKQVAIQLGGEVLLRDYFAAKAMQALLSQNLGGAVRDEILAGFSYAMADAMIKAKETK